jgi:hypothetical protein
MSSYLCCWNCGAALAGLSLPLGRQDQCADCSNYLHVCRMCVYFDPLVTDACCEDDAEEVKEKSQPNFCDYFKPSENAFDPARVAVAESSAAELSALFGEVAATPDENSTEADTNEEPLQSAADQLFSKD